MSKQSQSPPHSTPSGSAPSLEPWEQLPHIWKDSKAYFTWLRGSMRKIWSRHPIKIEYKNGLRFKAPIGRNGKLIWAIHCEKCGELHKQNEVEVDHLIQAGSFLDWQSFGEWQHRLIHVNFDGIRCLCKRCHGIVTLSQRNDTSFEEAAIEKECIAFGKLKPCKQKNILRELNAPKEMCNNARNRRKAYKIILLNKELVNDPTTTQES